MFIATELKKQNIVEYLLYMWQIEDLIRAFGLDMNRINEKIVKPYQLSDYDKKRLFEWYESLIEMMRTENAQDVGHIQLNKNIIIQLNDFHTELLNSGMIQAYNSRFFKLTSYLLQLRQKQNNPEITDIELCFNFLYGIMTLRMQKAENYSYKKNSLQITLIYSLFSSSIFTLPTFILASMSIGRRFESVEIQIVAG